MHSYLYRGGIYIRSIEMRLKSVNKHKDMMEKWKLTCSSAIVVFPHKHNERNVREYATRFLIGWDREALLLNPRFL